MNAAAARLIERLGLAPHPEGGWFRETHRSAIVVKTTQGDRSALTVIDFLLEASTFSAWHRLRADEAWHFATGDPVALELIAPDGSHETRLLGPDGPWNTTVAAGTWFAAHVAGPDGFTLVSCSVGPGFDFADFELADGAALAEGFPLLRALVERFSR